MFRHEVGLSGWIVRKAKEHWEANHLLETGVLIFERIPREFRSVWGMRILEVSCGYVFPSAEVEMVIDFAGEANKWGEGKAGRWREARLIVDAVNNLYHQTTESLPKQVLALARDVAKVVYNARWYPAPFDHSSGWRIVEDLSQVIRRVEDKGFVDRAWLSLCDERYLKLVVPTLCCPGCPVCCSLLVQNPRRDRVIAKVGGRLLTVEEILRIGGFSDYVLPNTRL